MDPNSTSQNFLRCGKKPGSANDSRNKQPVIFCSFLLSPSPPRGTLPTGSGTQRGGKAQLFCPASNPPFPLAAGEGSQGWRMEQDSCFSVTPEKGAGRLHFLSRNLSTARGQRCREILLGASFQTACIWMCCTNMSVAAGAEGLLLPSFSQGGEMRPLGGGKENRGHIVIHTSSSWTITKDLFSALSFRLMPVTLWCPQILITGGTKASQSPFCSTVPLIWVSHSPDLGSVTSSKDSEKFKTGLFIAPIHLPAKEPQTPKCTPSDKSNYISNGQKTPKPALGTQLFSCPHHHFLSSSRSRVRAFLSLETGCRVGIAFPKQSCHLKSTRSAPRQFTEGHVLKPGHTSINPLAL